ncbi:MAG TPA: phosphonate C-P lyase system protein PhnL [Xanthobacteraceae bacterium]|nr:phosphonate C-P lyase system protein PhnL [Xanthobacteraceae bacterium]
MYVLDLVNVKKSFILHLQGGLRLPVVNGVNFAVQPGECLALAGPSGCGKSSILKMIFGSYRCDGGHILVRDNDRIVDIATASPRTVITTRRRAVAYVSQFLRAVPRVATIDVVAQTLDRTSRDEARMGAAALLRRLNIPERLMAVPPVTFSGGEQQRVNIARGFLPERPLLLLDEPTASLDSENCAVVIDLIAEKKRRGVAVVAIVHDQDARNAIADRIVDIASFAAA